MSLFNDLMNRSSLQLSQRTLNIREKGDIVDMTRIVQAIRRTFVSAALVSTFGLPMVMNVPSAAAAGTQVGVYLNRPSSVWVGSAKVNGGSCISLSKQNQWYYIGPFADGTSISITRFSGGNCDGNRNPQDQVVNVAPNTGGADLTPDHPSSSDVVDIQNW